MIEITQPCKSAGYEHLEKLRKRHPVRMTTKEVAIAFQADVLDVLSKLEGLSVSEDLLHVVTIKVREVYDEYVSALEPAINGIYLGASPLESPDDIVATAVQDQIDVMHIDDYAIFERYDKWHGKDVYGGTMTLGECRSGLKDSDYRMLRRLPRGGCATIEQSSYMRLR